MRTKARDVLGFAIPASTLVALLAVPVAGLVWLALASDLRAYLADPSVHAAVKLSLGTTAVSSVLIIATGTPLAYALALLEVFGRRGWLGEPLAVLGVSLPFTTAAVVISQVFVAGPFYVRAARVGFAAIDPAIPEAAHVDGASEGQLFRHIMAPVAKRALLSGLVLAWARALGEFGATLFFAGNREGVTQTMPLAIFIGFESDMALAVGLSFVLLVSSIAVLLFAWLLGDRVEL